MRDLFRRLRYLLNYRRFDQELADDMEFHREMAAREGKGNLGNALHLREEARDAWGWLWVERLTQDLCYAARVLRKSPGFTLAAVFMLAIGIGVNVAVFGFFDLMVLRPLNVKDPATLLRFHRRGLSPYAFALPYPEMAFFRENSRTLSAVLGVNSTRVAVEGEEKKLNASFVTANYFRELGGTPILGRVLDAARDEASGAEPVVVLGHGYWQRHFGADPLVVGKTIRLNGKAATVVGVAASDFSGLSLSEPILWAPVTQQPYFTSGSRLLTDFSVESPGVQMWGRLGPGQNPKAAEEELRSLAAVLRRQHPTAIWEDERLPSEPGAYAGSSLIGNRRGTGTETRDPVYPIFALVGTLTLLILAVACGNLGSMLLARGVARQREIAIRAAIGAGNGRLVGQLFTESLLLAMLGSVAGAGGWLCRVARLADDRRRSAVAQCGAGLAGGGLRSSRGICVCHPVWTDAGAAGWPPASSHDFRAPGVDRRAGCGQLCTDDCGRPFEPGPGSRQLHRSGLCLQAGGFDRSGTIGARLLPSQGPSISGFAGGSTSRRSGCAIHLPGDQSAAGPCDDQCGNRHRGA